MEFKILFIEDNKTKSEDIKNFIFQTGLKCKLEIKNSFTSGLKEFFTGNYNLLLLDMSLPTRDDDFNTIDNFEHLGGFKIMSEMRRKNKIIPTILITMFSEFGIGKSFMDIAELDERLKESFNSFYNGYIFYSSQEDSWKDKLERGILEVYEDFNS